MLETQTIASFNTISIYMTILTSFIYLLTSISCKTDTIPCQLTCISNTTLVSCKIKFTSNANWHNIVISFSINRNLSRIKQSEENYSWKTKYIFSKYKNTLFRILKTFPVLFTVILLISVLQ